VVELIEQLRALRKDLVSFETEKASRRKGVHPNHSAGAVNLLHYVGLRRHDLRDLQDRLAELGLSSLGRAESHVLANLDKVLGLLHRVAGRPWESLSEDEPAGFSSARRLLEQHTDRLLGPPPRTRGVRIMVTLPTEAAHDYPMLCAMLAGGMDCARINCAHDGPDVWAAMVAMLERAKRELGRPCRVLMDLGGPKLRTGALEPGPAVLKWRPRRDTFGRVVAPARVFLRPTGDTHVPPEADACLEVDPAWLNELAEGDEIGFCDARGSKRVLTLVSSENAGRWCEATQTAYVTPETVLTVGRPKQHRHSGEIRVGGIPRRIESLLLHKGDRLVLTRDPAPGRPARYDERGKLRRPATLPCTLPEVFADVRPGDRIWLDDGKIGGVVRHVTRGQMQVEITVAREQGERLAADKGINLPDSELSLPALTAKDQQDLAFVVEHADLVGLSFVQRAGDVAALQDRLEALGGENVGIVLKIETRGAFENLPDLVLEAMASPSVGIMIARGDLAVECGYERLAEVQEEILWLAEAAHLPVIWATQVLETLAKTGQPSRAEITDAAMGERAECVMLNKGAHIMEAIHALDGILSRMEAHQHKKRSMLRKLHW